ncbi:Crp/Fnr family transcriptional regulator [Kitasatospora sp. GP82]|uniref:Crp/Fnr family transcriptional regulator n=1 Tax=Kitasatospora sp. GP82 TaxID=3035089 RepID=UPI0024754336|nr:Crp/Fnr family transcriptional regulator [Kitasatospora sp. GP82]MDH6123514.1 CRP/FNR family cyclic AMP-dependent transcriptional regulator [Kitasatospora sp. GP82]
MRRDRVAGVDSDGMQSAIWAKGTFLARLAENQAEQLLGMSRAVRYEAGSVLLSQGERTTHVCLLQPVDPGGVACAKVTATLENGTETLLSIRVSGDLVGEQAALRMVPRAATVTACSAVLVNVVTRERFLGFLREHPDAWEAVGSVMADRLDSANRRRLDFAAFDVVGRLSRVLVELVERHGQRVDTGHEIGVHLSQLELGRLIGAREDAVGLAMRRLKAEGLVRPHYRKVTVTDLAALRGFAEQE